MCAFILCKNVDFRFSFKCDRFPVCVCMCVWSGEERTTARVSEPLVSGVEDGGEDEETIITHSSES